MFLYLQGTGRARDLLFPLQTCVPGVLLRCLFSVVLKCSGVGEQVLVLRLQLSRTCVRHLVRLATHVCADLCVTLGETCVGAEVSVSQADLVTPWHDRRAEIVPFHYISLLLGGKGTAHAGQLG
jgi:hypothetical protein